jgi:S1-C subfamily serine protease
MTQINTISYRTMTPFDGGLSRDLDQPSKTKFVPLFGNTPLLEDMIDGESGGFNDLKGRGSWSSEPEEDHSYHEEGSEYRLDLSLQKLDEERAKFRKEHGRWIVETNDGNRYEYPSKAVADAQMKVMPKSVKRQWKAAANAGVVNKVINACVQVISKPADGNGGVGAAFCISPGKFLTCAHVIMPYDIGLYFDDQAFMSVQIDLTVSREGQTSPARLVTVDLKKDIALIEADFESNILELSNSRDHDPGEPVIVVGSPKGFENSVSEGIISGLSRVVFSHDGAPKHIFTDAKILPGNSGGPLVSLLDGKVIGMVEIIVGEDAPYGLNAAIETEYLSTILQDSLITTKKIENTF